jgi:methionine-rich copper-binding protein CopC
MRLWFQRMLPTLAAGLVVLPGAAGVAVLHAHLTGSHPARDEVVAEAPRAIRLTFSEKTEVAVSDIKVFGADSAAIRMGKVERGDDSLTIEAPVLGSLGSGEFAVVWRTAAKDGHPIRGRYTFRIEPRPAPADTARPRPAESGTRANR